MIELTIFPEETVKLYHSKTHDNLENTNRGTKIFLSKIYFSPGFYKLKIVFAILLWHNSFNGIRISIVEYNAVTALSTVKRGE